MAHEAGAPGVKSGEECFLILEDVRESIRWDRIPKSAAILAFFVKGPAFFTASMILILSASDLLFLFMMH